MIVKLSEYRDERRPALKKPSVKEGFAEGMATGSTDCDRQLSDSQIFDLEHHRRLKALHTHLEGGATLSEAARLIGVSQMTAYRWNDHGRR
ncbi:helix-turn-helix domain-containing protein [Luminiphilus sp.]|nr:helix-turn-helix domain-containing protein [Luminiphilus sp.]